MNSAGMISEPGRDGLYMTSHNHVHMANMKSKASHRNIMERVRTWVKKSVALIKCSKQLFPDGFRNTNLAVSEK
jgi:hypothetical protein